MGYREGKKRKRGKTLQETLYIANIFWMPLGVNFGSKLKFENCKADIKGVRHAFTDEVI